MQVTHIAILGADHPTDPCKNCGTKDKWRDSIDGELFGSICLECGYNQLGHVHFGEPEVIEEPDPTITVHPDGSATLQFHPNE